MMILLHSILCINVKLLVVNPVVCQNDFWLFKKRLLNSAIANDL